MRERCLGIVADWSQCQYLFVPVVGSKGQASGGGANWPQDLHVRRWKISEHVEVEELALGSARGEGEEAVGAVAVRAELIN
jgi:hypothetical protein